MVGAPQSGKSTALRTLICGLALTHTPAEVQIYCLDFGGGSLVQIRDLPHVGGVYGRLEAGAVRRTVMEVYNLLVERERRFVELGVDSMATYRKRRAAGGATINDPFGDVFLIIDGWVTFKQNFEDLEPIVADIASRGLSYGVHVVATAQRWMDFRPAIRDLLGSRLELRLGDPTDSMISRRDAENVPNSPGRGITSDKLHFLTALPQLKSLGNETAALVEAVGSAWNGPRAPRVRMLPDVVPYSELDLSETTGLRLPIGVGEDLRQISIDFASEPHLLLFKPSSTSSPRLNPH